MKGSGFSNRVALLICVAVLLFGSCDFIHSNEEPDPIPIEQEIAINVSSSEITLPDTTTGSTTFTISVNADWSIDLSETKTAPEWLSVYPTKGAAGTHLITVSVTEANSDYDDRTAYLILTVGDKSRSLIVTQNKKNAIIVSKKRYEVAVEGEVIEVEVKSNITYSVAVLPSSKNWITHKPTKGLNSTIEYFEIAPSEEEEIREGIIVFENGSLKDTVHIFQAQKDILILSNDELHLPSSAGEYEIQVRSNIEYNIDCQVSWITESQTKSVNEYYHYFYVAANDEYDVRSGMIIFTDTKSNICDTLFVEQDSNFDIFIEQLEYLVPREGGRIEVEVRTNLEDVGMIFHENCSTWLSSDESIKTKALTNQVYTLIALANDTYDERVGLVTFQDPEGIFQKTISIKQNQKDGLILSNKNYDLSFNSGSINVEVESNINYEITILSDWISEVTTKGLTTDHYEFFISENSDSHQREGKILFQDKDSYLSDTITVTQTGIPSVTLDRYSYDINYLAGSFTIIGHTNSDFSVSVPADDLWLRYTGKSFENTSDSQEFTLKFSIEKNMVASPRTSIISITPDGRDEGVKLTITQRAVLLPSSSEFGIYNNNTAVYAYSKYHNQTALRVSSSSYTFRILNLTQGNYCSFSSLPLDFSIGSTLSFDISTSDEIPGFSLGRKTGVVAKVENNVIWVLDSANSSVCYILMK